jgi:hypothetical protein
VPLHALCLQAAKQDTAGTKRQAPSAAPQPSTVGADALLISTLVSLGTRLDGIATQQAVVATQQAVTAAEVKQLAVKVDQQGGKMDKQAEQFGTKFEKLGEQYARLLPLLVKVEKLGDKQDKMFGLMVFVGFTVLSLGAVVINRIPDAAANLAAMQKMVPPV